MTKAVPEGMQPVPWTQAKYLDQQNEASGFNVQPENGEEFEVLSMMRRRQVMRRVADFNSIPATMEALSHQAAVELFKDARRLCNILAGDNLAKRSRFARWLRWW